MPSARRGVVIALIGSAEWREVAQAMVGSPDHRILHADSPEDPVAAGADGDRPDLFVIHGAPVVVERFRERMRSAVPMPFLVAIRDPGTRAADLLGAGADAVVDATAASGLLTAQVRAGLRRTSRQRRFFEERRALTRRASTDALTGLPNRGAFDEAIAAEVARAHRYHRPLSLAILDIDHFKDVNDRHGHPAGDRVLAAVAGRLSARHRAGETVARFGGEEFAWLLPETAEEAAIEACERSRIAVSAMELPGIGRVSISAGVAALAGGEPPAGLLERADRALYAAKEGGRDRVAASRPVEPPPPAGDGDAVLAYLRAAERYDQSDVMRIASRLIDAEGLVGLCENLLEPALDEVGRLWERGDMSVATEHLVTGLSEKLLTEFPVGGEPGGPLIVLAGAPRNAHRLGLLAVTDLLASLGWRPVVLGAHTPVSGLAEIALRLDAPAVGITVGTTGDLRGLAKELEGLVAALPGRAILVGGNAIRRSPRWRPPAGVRAVRGAAETVRIAGELRKALVTAAGGPRPD